MSNNLDITGAEVLDELFPDTGETSSEVQETAEGAVVAAQETQADLNLSNPAQTEKTVEKSTEQDNKTEDASEKTGVPAGFVPIPVHAELRAKSREREETLRQQLAEAQVARAKAEARAELLAELAEKGITTTAAKQPEVVEPSPLEKFDAEFPGEAVPAKVLIEQRQWERHQADQQATKTQTQTLAQQVNEGVAEAKQYYSADRMGSDDLTLDAVVALAQDHGLLSNQDKLNLAPYGKRAGMMLYTLATDAIRRAGGTPLQELNRRVVTARQTLAQRNVKQTTTTTTNKPQPQAKAVAAAQQPTKATDDSDADVSGITGFIFGTR